MLGLVGGYPGINLLDWQAALRQQVEKEPSFRLLCLSHWDVVLPEIQAAWQRNPNLQGLEASVAGWEKLRFFEPKVMEVDRKLNVSLFIWVILRFHVRFSGANIKSN